MKTRILFIACSLLFLNSISAQTTVTGSFFFGGINRTYRLYVPVTYNAAKATPLVMNLHGYGSNNVEQELYGNFKPIADTAGFLLVHPNGTPDQTNTNHWNNFGTSNVDDVGFLSALIDTLAKSYNINQSRVYSTGMSNGGFMSYALACNLSQRIAAVASVTGSMTNAAITACNPSRSTPVMQIHGTADATVPYAGNFLFAPIENVVALWVTKNNCSSTPVITQVPNTNTVDGCTATHYVYVNGQNGKTVEFYKVNGGGHSWPGAPINLNVTNQDFSASVEIWRFFRKYNLNGLIAGETETPEHLSLISVSPNPAYGKVLLRFANHGIKKVSIRNALGREIYSFKCDQTEKEISIEEAGLFIVSVEQNGKIQIAKTLIIK